MTKRRKFIIAAALLAAAGAVIAWLLLRSEGYHPFSSLSASDIALCHADGATSYTETAQGEKASMPAVYMLTQEETDELLTLMHKITYEKNDDGETALHVAARRGHVGVVRELLRAGAKDERREDAG